MQPEPAEELADAIINEWGQRSVGDLKWLLVREFRACIESGNEANLKRQVLVAAIGSLLLSPAWRSVEVQLNVPGDHQAGLTLMRTEVERFIREREL